MEYTEEQVQELDAEITASIKAGKDLDQIEKEIKVKISDLKEGSHALVKVKCDNCGDESDLPYIQYLTAIKGRIANGDYYCPNCISKLNRGENHHSWNPALTQEEREINRYSTDWS